MQHYVDSVTAFNGDKVTNASITVTTLAGNTAPIYLDVNGTMPVTAVSTNTNGEFNFYVEPGRYNINVSGTGIVSYSLLDVFIFYPNATGLLPVNIGGTGVNTSTGTGSVVLNISPTLVTPILGTPANGNLSNCTGIPAGGITGTLPVANGGTGATTNAGTAYALKGANADITSITGLTTALSVGQGGTGLATLTAGYIPYGNGTGALSSNAGLFYDGTNVGIGTNSPANKLDVAGTAKFGGSTSQIAAILANAAETTNITAAALTGVLPVYLALGAVQYYTAVATGSWTPNISLSSLPTTLNTALAIGQSTTVAFMATQGTTAYFSNALQIDGTTVTLKWQGGTAPTAGNVSGIDVYTYTIVKTAASTYTVLASMTQFK